MLRQSLALMLCAALAATGCASTGVRVAQGPATPVVDRQVMRDYAERLPAGSRVRVEEADGRSLRGTLMKTTDSTIIVQKNTRIPEAPVEIPIERIARISLDTPSNGSTGRAIGIGIAAGVGATLAFLAILFATIDD